MSTTPEPTENKEMEPETTPVVETTPAPEPQAEPAAPRKKTGKGGIIMDCLLVLVLVGALGAGAWFIKQELDKYNVPSPMEVAQNEYLELCKQHEELQAAAYKADELIRMRSRIAGLEGQIIDTRRQIADIRNSVKEEAARARSLQREIRQEDKTSRAVARSLMIGLPIGNAATSNGRAYPDAVIHRLKAGSITLRHPAGQATFPLSNLVKDNLPDIVRYALGIDDMVDMSDFDKAPKRRKGGKLIAPRTAPVQSSTPADYEPAQTAPVVNTQAPDASSATPAGGLMPEGSNDTSWQAPDAPLPIAEP